jgi:hypothetical protein
VILGTGLARTQKFQTDNTTTISQLVVAQQRLLDSSGFAENNQVLQHSCD